MSAFDQKYRDLSVLCILRQASTHKKLMPLSDKSDKIQKLMKEIIKKEKKEKSTLKKSEANQQLDDRKNCEKSWVE